MGYDYNLALGALRMTLGRSTTEAEIDINDDGMADFVLYDSQVTDGTVRVGVNLGVLPASPK